MKKITTLFLLAFALNSFAQDCQNPVSNSSFQSFFNSIATQSTNEKKLERATDLITHNCITSQQVKNIAILFSDDKTRLEFCRLAWHKTFDRVNFFDVYDAFASISNAIRLYDYTKSSSNNEVVVIPAPPVEAKPEDKEPIFGDYQYPNHLNYNGPRGCPGPPVNDIIFMTIARKACCLPYDDQRSQYIIENTKGLCISMSQAMKLTSFIHTHFTRLHTMKQLFPGIYDQGNFQSANQLFNTQELKTDWTNTIELTLKQTDFKPPVVDCKATDADLNNIIKSVNSKTFPTDKMDALKLAAKNRCYSLTQIRKLCELFMIDNDKLAVMKIFYAKSPDKEFYDQLTDVFIAYYYQQELMTFIKNGGK